MAEAVAGILHKVVARRALVLAVLALCCLLACSTDEKDKSTAVREDDAAMNKAMAEARATLDEFTARLRDPKPGDDAFSVKVKVTDENGTEHFWASDVQVVGSGFQAVIDNDPNIVKSVKLGQTVKVTRDEVSDWMYMTNGKMIGNRTLRVLLSRMPNEEADALKKEVGWE